MRAFLRSMTVIEWMVLVAIVCITLAMVTAGLKGYRLSTPEQRFTEAVRDVVREEIRRSR